MKQTIPYNQKGIQNNKQQTIDAQETYTA